MTARARAGSRTAVAALVAADGLTLVGALWLAYHLRFCHTAGPTARCLGLMPIPRAPTLYGRVMVLQLATTLLLLWMHAAYARPHPFSGLRQYTACLNAVPQATLSAVFGTCLFDRSASLSRGYLLLSCIAGATLLCAQRFATRRLLHTLRRRRLLIDRAVIVGTSTEAQVLEWILRRQPRLGYHVIGFVDDAWPPGASVQAGLTVLGPLARLREIVEDHRVTQVVVARSSLSHDGTLQALQQAAATDAVVALSCDHFQILATGARIVDLPGIPLLGIEKVRLTGGDRVLKTALDRGLALVLLVALGPALLALAVLVRWRMGAPVLDRVPALGMRGRVFSAFKFRTTTCGERAALSTPRVQARLLRGLPARDFPDVTPLGRILRRYSLDELPQLLNVLRGEMSIVGPYKIYPEQAPLYGRHLLSVTAMKPGITGICQISGRGELPPEERAILDADYVRNYTIWRDLSILAQTLRTVVHGRGAY
ncbi:MAG: sugar transferase [Chloroflexota bacterium]